MKENRLYRIVNGKVIGGVAGGIAEFFNMDPTIIRILFILLTIMGGGGLLVYIVLWIVVPEKYNVIPPFNTGFTRTETTSSSSGIGETYEGYETGRPLYTETKGVNNNKVEGSLIAGLILVLIGGFFLIERYIPQISFSDFWPLLLIVIGIVMILKGVPLLSKKSENENITNDNQTNTNNDLNL